jgi:hypothetical protein
MVSELSPRLERACETLNASDWPPDVFAVLFDILAFDTVWQSVQDQFINAERNPLLISDDEARFRAGLIDPKDPSVRAWRVSAEFRRRALEAIHDAELWIEDSTGADSVPDGTGFPRQIAYLARAIDAEAAELSLYGKSLLADKFQEALDVLNSQTTFTKTVGGRVIPAAAKSERGNTVQKFFSHLLRIPEGTDRFVDYRVNSSISTRRPGQPLRIGFIPTVHSRDEVVWGLSRDRFTVALSPKHEDKIARRVIGGLKWLLQEGVDVVLIPELVSSLALRNRICAWLKDKAPAHPLLVVCGSEAVKSGSATRRTNRAFVVGPSGRLLWTQDKHHQHSMSAEEIEKLGLRSVLGSRKRNEIGTSSRWRVVICDIPGSGRFCILVCEDFARGPPGQEAIRLFEVDMGLVIVMDSLFDATGWRQRYAHIFAQEPGSRIAIGNSRALISRLPDGGKRDSMPEDVAFYCLQKQCLMHKKWWPNGPVSKASALLIVPEVKV